MLGARLCGRARAMPDVPADILCLACMLWHEPPQCQHDPGRGCLTCGRPRGYRFRDNDGRPHRAVECFRCACGLPDARVAA